MSEPSLLQGSSTFSPQPPLLRRVTAKQVISSIIGVVLAFGLVLTILDANELIVQSTGDLVMLCLLLSIAASAGGYASWQRKKGYLESAVTAYRITVWCLFLSLFALQGYFRDRRLEEFLKRFHEERQIIEQHQKQ